MRTHYVSTMGSDSGAGTLASPWRTINHAMAADLQSGATVVVMPGTYNESIRINVGGSPRGYVTLKSQAAGAARIVAPEGGGNAISINASYVILDGFDIKGRDACGIAASSVHHIRIRNNTVHDASQSGIQTTYCEFVLIERNETYRNATSGRFAGISVCECRNVTGNTAAAGYRTIVRYNVSRHNGVLNGPRTGGDGIVIDDLQRIRDGEYPGYACLTLVKQNLAYENGGKGLVSTWSDHITVRNNRAYGNARDRGNPGARRGEPGRPPAGRVARKPAVGDAHLNRNGAAVGAAAFDRHQISDIVTADSFIFKSEISQASVG